MNSAKELEIFINTTRFILEQILNLLKEMYLIRTFKDYAKLNEERKVILDAIERDGRIYG